MGAAEVKAPAGVDLYGTSQLTLEAVNSRWGSDFTKLVQSLTGGDMDSFLATRQKIVAEVRETGRFAYVEVAVISYYTDGNPIYVTLDVVEQEDRATRMDFLPAPTGNTKIPTESLRFGPSTEQRGFELSRKNELPPMKEPCPAFHCVFGFEHPDLRKYLEPFRAGAAKHKRLLTDILRGDADASHRARAAYLLGHTTDADDLVGVLIPVIRDSSGEVRNNVMRVLAYIAEHRKDVRIPLAPVLQATNFPNTTDRNKSLAIVAALADDPANREPILREAGPRLLKLLYLLQPNNHDYAYSILKKISGEMFGEWDYPQWEKWVANNLPGSVTQ